MLQGPPYVRLPRATACPDAVYCQRLTSALRANSNFLLPSTFLRSLLRFLRLVIPTCRARITLPTSGRSCEHTTRLIQKPGPGTSFIRPAVQCGRHGLAELARLAPPAWHFSVLPLRSCRFGPAASVRSTFSRAPAARRSESRTVSTCRARCSRTRLRGEARAQPAWSGTHTRHSSPLPSSRSCDCPGSTNPARVLRPGRIERGSVRDQVH